MKVSVISDLHLEFGFAPELPGGDLLLMAGDIFTAFPLRSFRQDAASAKARARYANFCEKQLSKYKRVLYVMGNHEHYRELFEESAGLLRPFLEKHAPNLRLLDDETEIIAIGGDRIAVVGTTLWAHSGAGTAEEWRIGNAMRDFSLIRTKAEPPPGKWHFQGERAFRPFDAQIAHRKALHFLVQETPKHDRVILLTHHAPSFQSGAGHLHNTDYLDDAYCSNLVDFILAHPQIEYAIHGHTHHDVRYQIGGTRVITNHHGYRGYEAIAKRFDASAADFHLDAKGTEEIANDETNRGSQPG